MAAREFTRIPTDPKDREEIRKTIHDSKGAGRAMEEYPKVPSIIAKQAPITYQDITLAEQFASFEDVYDFENQKNPLPLQ